MPHKKLGTKRSLTTREQSILTCIKNKIRENGFPPTVREICNEVGLRSTSTVHGYLARLEELVLSNVILPALELLKLQKICLGGKRK